MESNMKVNKKQTLIERMQSWPQWARGIIGLTAMLAAVFAVFCVLVVIAKYMFNLAVIVWNLIP
jgi:hypothetical protein